jgi:RNA polymerase sigma-70 factor (ECF subfamily)
MTPATPDTEELIERAAAGEAGATNKLWERHRERLRRMIAVRLDRRIAARVDPSDVVQEALADAARALPEYLRRPPLPFQSWLRQFAWDRLMKLHRHHIRSQKRSVHREEVADMFLSDESVARLAHRLVQSGTSPGEHAIRAEVRDRVKAALAKMSPHDREVLVMRNLEGLPVAEIAEVLGITASSVKVRHLRALQRLRTLLGEEDLE